MGLFRRGAAIATVAALTPTLAIAQTADRTVPAEDAAGE